MTIYCPDCGCADDMHKMTCPKVSYLNDPPDRFPAPPPPSTITPEDKQLLETYALHQAARVAEEAHTARYRESSRPSDVLAEAIFELLASTTFGILDRELSDHAVSMTPSRFPEWNADMRPRLRKRLESDYVFGKLVQAQTAMIMQEFEAWYSAKISPIELYATGIGLMRTVASEREECAHIAEGPIFGLEQGTPEGVEIARLIRERK